MKHVTVSFLILMMCFTPYAEAAHAKRIKVYADFDKPVLLAGESEDVVIKVGLSALEAPVKQARIPLNIAIVLDKSGSMASQNKIENAKSAAIEIIERLNKNDIVSLIVYDNSASVLMPAQPMKNKEHFIHTIEQIRADGSTALYAGITDAANEIRKFLSSEYLNRIILLSDGLANVGPQSTEDLASLGINLNEENVSVTTVGVGLDYNEDLMGSLADSSGGNIYFAQNSDRLPEIFSEEIGEAATLMAQKIRITIECADGVVPLGTIGRKSIINGQNIELTINNLYATNEKDALFEVRVPAGTAKKQIEIARVNVEYFDPFTQATLNEAQALNIRFENNQNAVTKAMNKKIIKDVELTRTSEIKQQAILLADKGEYQQADNLLNFQANRLEKVAKECDNDAELFEEAKKSKESSWVEHKKNGSTNFFRKQQNAVSQSQINDQYMPGYSEWAQPVYPKK